MAGYFQSKRGMGGTWNGVDYIYCIASNYGLGVYFFPAFFTRPLNGTNDYMRLAFISSVFQAMNF